MKQRRKKWIGLCLAAVRITYFTEQTDTAFEKNYSQPQGRITVQ